MERGLQSITDTLEEIMLRLFESHPTRTAQALPVLLYVSSFPLFSRLTLGPLFLHAVVLFLLFSESLIFVYPFDHELL